MSKTGEWMEKELDGLRQVRDELRVQAELGKAELRDRLGELDKRWHELEGKLEVIGDEARDDLEDVKEAASLLVDELVDGYKHLRSRL